MKLLAVDTALGACSAAVLDGEAVLAHSIEPMERGHAERLAPMVQEVISRAGIGLDALDRLAVSVGPGTFTGQRVGYAFMRGLRLALGRPLAGVTTLAAMAAAAMAENCGDAAAVLHDARRGEVYFSLVTRERTEISERVVSFEKAVEAILGFDDDYSGDLTIAGTAASEAAGRLRAERHNCLQSNIVVPDALWIARLAMIMPEPASIPRPLYLRPPDARLPSPPP